MIICREIPEVLSGWIETLYLSCVKDMDESIIEGMNTPLEDCIPEEDVRW